MKKAMLALTAALVTLGAIGVSASARADEPHHHRVCHRVHVHGHWENRCH